MSNLDDRIKDALHDLDGRVANAVYQPRSVRHRPLRIVLPVVAALAVLAVVVGSVVIGRQQDRADSVVPSEQVTASQTPEQAAVDGVYPQIAALTWRQRIGPTKIADPVLSTRAKNPVTLKLVRPDLTKVTGFGADGCLPPVDAKRSYPVCRDSGYTELLVLAAGTRQIVRAYPLPAKITWLTGVGGNLYCGKDGGWAAPDSALCRLDLDTLDLTGTVFQCDQAKGTCGQGDPALSRYPGTWFESPKIDGAARVAASDDPKTLSVLAQNSRITAQVDPDSLAVKVITPP